MNKLIDEGGWVDVMAMSNCCPMKLIIFDGNSEGYKKRMEKAGSFIF
jgi:hypothetical protein